MNFLYVAFNNNWNDAAAIFRMNTTLDVKMLLKKKRKEKKISKYCLAIFEHSRIRMNHLN